MKEAYEVAYKEAQKWSEDAYVIQITSTDFHDTENCENGVKGKRNCWSFLFESKKKDVQYAMYIDHGVPTAVQEVRSPGFQAIPMEEISIDTSELYDLARLQGLQGGKDWAFGYHYTLQYTYLNGTDKTPTLTYTIRGINQEEKEEKIIVDPITAKLLFILVKEGYDESGHSIWKKLGEDIPEEAFVSLKSGLMGPCAGVGDTLSQVVLIPILIIIFINLALQGATWAPIAYTVIFLLIFYGIGYWMLFVGYKNGGETVFKIMESGILDKVIDVANILGCAVTGALLCNYVSFSWNVVMVQNEVEIFNLQTGVFDAILPNAMPLLLTLGVYAAVKKGVKASYVTFGMMIIGFLLGLTGLVA